MTNWQKLLFSVPIAESFTDEKREFFIKGIAINETTTRNGITYLAEELNKSATSLIGKPLLKDHKNEVDSIVGRVSHAQFDNINKNIQFTAQIVDEVIKEKVKKNLINNVSIGATVTSLDELQEATGKKVVARGIDFLELSLVAVPSDPNAGFTAAIFESLNLKDEMSKVLEKVHCPECDKEFENKELMLKHKKKEHEDLDEKIKVYIDEIESLKKELEKKEAKIQFLENRKINIEVI